MSFLLIILNLSDIGGDRSPLGPGLHNSMLQVRARKRATLYSNFIYLGESVVRAMANIWHMLWKWADKPESGPHSRSHVIAFHTNRQWKVFSGCCRLWLNSDDQKWIGAHNSIHCVCCKSPPHTHAHTQQKSVQNWDARRKPSQHIVVSPPAERQPGRTCTDGCTYTESPASVTETLGPN